MYVFMCMCIRVCLYMKEFETLVIEMEVLLDDSRKKVYMYVHIYACLYLYV
jgi:hypothetical protein